MRWGACCQWQCPRVTLGVWLGDGSRWWQEGLGTLEPGFGKDYFSVKTGSVGREPRVQGDAWWLAGVAVTMGLRAREAGGMDSESADFRENNLEDIVNTRRTLALPLGLATKGCCLRQGRMERAC